MRPVPGSATRPDSGVRTGESRTGGSRPNGQQPGGYRTGESAYRRVAVAVFAGGVATFASLYSTQALLPLLGSGFGVGAGAAATSVSVATLGMAAGLLVSGQLSDRFGRTPLMRWSLVVAALLGLLTALAPSWPCLLALRAAEGLALSSFPAAAAAYLREEVDPAVHARVSGLYIGGTGVGGMLGRLVAAIGAGLGGWRVGLGAVGVLAAACAFVCWRLLPASRTFSAVPRANAVQTLKLTARLARDPAMAAMWLIGALVMGAFVATFNTIGFRLTAAPFDFGVALVGSVFLVNVFGSAASTLAGRAAGRWGRGVVVPIGAGLQLLGVLLTAAHSLPLIIFGLVILTCGFFATHGVVSGWVAARAESYQATGHASAVYLVLYYLGSSVCGADACAARGEAEILE